MVWDRWGWRKRYKKKLRDYKRGKESEALFGRTPSAKLLFLSNNDSDGIEYQFLNNGLTYRTGKEIADALDREQRGIGECGTNSQCPTGYACIDGTCVKIYTRDGSQWGTCGDGQINFPCRTKSDKQCSNSRPGPGDCLESDCGAGNPKCCRQNPNGSVDCYCGNCEDVEWGLCDPFCDSYYKSFGINPAGCNSPSDDGGGPCGGNICSACEECNDDEFAGTFKCNPYQFGDIGAPCWCSEVGCDKPCEKCNKDNESPEFGDCEFKADICQSCCSRTNVECPCGILIPFISTCTSYDGLTCPNVLFRKIAAECDKLCENEPDPCLPTCTTQTFTIDAADLGTFEPGPCPTGNVCRKSGEMIVGSEAVVFYEKCNFDDSPESCKEVECNCNADCATCKSCNAEGKCEDDPSCQNLTFTVRARYGGGRYAVAQAFGGVGCTGCSQSTISTTTRTFTGQSINDVWEWRITSTYTDTWTSGNPCDPCEDDFLAPNQQLTATVYYLFKNDELYTDGTYPSGITYTDQYLFNQSFQDGSGAGKVKGNTGTIEYTPEPQEIQQSLGFVNGSFS